MAKRVVIIPGDDAAPEAMGFADAAQRLDKAVSAVYAEGQYLTPDQGGKGLTTEFCQAVKKHL